MVGESSSSVSVPAGYLMNSTNASGAISLIVRNDRTDGISIAFTSGLTVVGSISQNGSGTLYNTTSDYRLKSISGAADTGALIDAVPVYDAKINHGVKHPMFLAHELQAHAPWAVTGDKDAVDASGEPIYQMVDHSALVASLWAEIQALRQRVQNLERGAD